MRIPTLLALAITLGLQIHAATLARAAEGQKKPNLLFIVVDDQSPFDLKVYDPESQLETPNIDRLAANGLVFDGAYQMGSWSGAVCTPSRHMIMSGRTVWHIPGKKLKQPRMVCPCRLPGGNHC